MDDLVVWLRQQIDLDEASEWPHRPSCQMLKPVPAGTPGFRALFATFSCNCDAATRWMQEFEAKRRIIDALEQLPHYAWDGREEYGCPKYTDPEAWRGEGAEQTCNCGRDDHVDRVLRLLALPYSERPGYREEWKQP